MNSSVTSAILKIAAELEPEDPAPLVDALILSYYDDEELPTLMEQIKAYSIMAHYYPKMTDIKRHTRGGDKLAYMFLEEYLEGRLKTLDKGIIGSMHLNKVTGMHNV